MYPSVEKIPADEILYTGREGAELMSGNHPTVLCFRFVSIHVTLKTLF